MSKWTHSICDTCWNKQNDFREPSRLREAPPEVCCYCGVEHASGIYRRENPDGLKCQGTQGTHANA